MYSCVDIAAWHKLKLYMAELCCGQHGIIHSASLILFANCLCDNFSDSSSDCSSSSLWPPNSTGTRDIANASCCRGNSSPSTSSANSSSSSDSITNETSIAGKRPKRYYWLHILPHKCVKVQLDRLELLAMLDRYSALFLVTNLEIVSRLIIILLC